MSEPVPPGFTPIFDKTRHFVNRTEELKPLQRALRQLKQPLQLPLVNVVGVPGIGKSALFQKIYEDCRDSTELYTIGYIFDKSNPSALRSDFIQKIEQQPPLIEKFTSREISEESDDVLLSKIASVLAEESKQKPLLLLIDGCEYITSDDLGWLEVNLLRKLVTNARALVILSSQTELRWSSFEMRRRTTTLELQALDPTSSQQQLDALPLISAQIYELTSGYPLANELAVNELHDIASHPTLDEASRTRVLLDSVGLIRERVVGGVSDDLWRILQVVSLLREFDAEMLQDLLPVVNKEWKGLAQFEIFDKIRQLLATRLCRADDLIRAYRMADPIRAIIAAEYQLNDAATANEIHGHAMQLYYDRLANVPRSRNRYVAEYYYHWAIYNHSSKTYNVDDAREKFKGLIQQHYFSADGRFVDDEGLKELQRLLKGDAELKRALRKRGLPADLLIGVVKKILDNRNPAENRQSAKLPS